jgi:nucleoside-diphosphate-sugar epimerase
MTTIAITGIGGFIGLRMAKRALRQGWTVRGIDLSPAGVERARQLGAEATVGDVNDADALAEVFAGCDLVFHTAAVVQEDGPRELYDRVNNQGTRTVCQVAQAQGVHRLIHLSSIMVYGFNYSEGVTEEGPFDVAGNPYNETKLSSERIALSFNQPEQGFGVIVIRPGDVYGLGSVPWVMRPIEAMQKHQFILPDRGRGVINHVHVDNLISGVLLAYEHDRCGEAFNITDDQATPSAEFFLYQAQMLGRKRIYSVPSWVMAGAVQVTDRLLPKIGIASPMKPSAIKFLLRRNKISCAKAREQLGYRPTISLAEGMKQLEIELRAAHLIP